MPEAPSDAPQFARAAVKGIEAGMLTKDVMLFMQQVGMQLTNVGYVLFNVGRGTVSARWARLTFTFSARVFSYCSMARRHYLEEGEQTLDSIVQSTAQASEEKPTQDQARYRAAKRYMNSGRNALACTAAMRMATLSSTRLPYDECDKYITPMAPMKTMLNAIDAALNRREMERTE